MENQGRPGHLPRGKKIPVDQDIYEWLGEPLQPKQAIPDKGKAYDLLTQKPAEEVGELQGPITEGDYAGFMPGLQAIPGAIGQPAPREALADRRKDLEQRKKIGEMSPEEMKRELLVDPLTGLGNRRAYEETERLPYQSMIDVDSLKAVNDIMGHDKGDELIKAVGQALGENAKRAFHTSGDEFIVEGETPEEIDAQLKRAQERLQNAEIEYTAPDGTVFKYKGLEFSYGTSKSLGEADQRLAAIKTEREKQGLRAARGQRPPGMAEIPAAWGAIQGQPAEIKQWEDFQKTLSAIPPSQTRQPQTAIPAITPEEYGAQASKAAEMERAAREAATSPTNAIPEPTEKQKEAGNYKKGHVNIQGLDISIENPRGSVRSGTTKEGKPWQTNMTHHYGYILGTKGRDKDHIDAFIGPNPESEQVFVVDQVEPDSGNFDEHKVLLGFNSLEEAKQGYLSNYESGWKGMGGISTMPMAQFKEWIKGSTTKPLSDEMYKPERAIDTKGEGPKAAIPESVKLPPFSITTAPSGIYKGWKQATATEGPHEGVVAFGRDDEAARAELARLIKGREDSGIGIA